MENAITITLTVADLIYFTIFYVVVFRYTEVKKFVKWVFELECVHNKSVRPMSGRALG